MARVVILGAGVSGHTAALHLRRRLGKQHTVTVVSPTSQWNWIPSNLWVGVGEMPKKDVVFAREPVYRGKGIEFRQTKAVAMRPRAPSTNQPRGDRVHRWGDAPARRASMARMGATCEASTGAGLRSGTAAASHSPV